MKGLIALVGRPNVGKSTLFNRIVGRRLAVVSDVAGTTRDRLYASSEWNGVAFDLVDTGGIELIEGWHTEPLSEDSERFLPMIRQQAAIAIQEAEAIVFVVDGQTGVTAADSEVAEILRQTNKPIFIAANKLESTKERDNAFDFYEFGVGEVFAISAQHSVGVADLLDQLIEVLPAAEIEEEDDSVKIALLGRPNVGKSTLLNRLIGEDRAIVSPIAGTTRDAFDTKFEWNDQEITLIDTAGIRRRGRIDQGIEKYSVLRSMKALQRADVALLLIDAVEGITAQDQHIAGMIQEASCGVCVLINKWDAIAKDSHTIYEYEDHIRSELNFMPYVPFLFISAQEGQRTHKVLELAHQVNESRYHRIGTGALNRILRDALLKHAPPGQMSRLRFYYVTQVSVAPPVFIFFVNRPQIVHFTYRRYLENRIREEHPFPGTPIRLVFRARDEGE